MKDRPRIVVDTNALVSRLLLPSSVPAQAVRRAVNTSQLLVSEATMNELADVLSRRKFDRYISMEDRLEFVRLLGHIAEMVPIIDSVHACRDPKDDKFLEAAVNGSAVSLISGDTDLLILSPFQGVAIISPAAYLETFR